jgi:release factor glutamine methyltransferase
MSIAGLLNAAAVQLAAAGVERPRREARLLLAHALGTTAEALLRDPQREVDPDGFAQLVAERTRRQPLAYLIGRRGFWSLDFEVSPAALIPRPETETLIEAALAAFPHRDAVRTILDLGTGTGCLLLAALHEFPRAWGVGVDRSAAAIALAGRNAGALGMRGRCAFLTADWGRPLAADFDLVLANPPYIRTTDIPGLMPEVAQFEPAAALDGGADGLDAYRCIVTGLGTLLAPEGRAILELGAGQKEPVQWLARAAGLAVEDTRPDLAGIPRALVLREPAKNRLAGRGGQSSLHPRGRPPA